MPYKNLQISLPADSSAKNVAATAIGLGTADDVTFGTVTAGSISSTGNLTAGAESGADGVLRLWNETDFTHTTVAPTDSYTLEFANGTYGDARVALAWPDEGTATLDFGGVTASRTFVFPDASGTLLTTTGSGASLTGITVGQVSGAAPLASPTFTGTVVLPSTTSIGTITNTELSYLDGVTSALQTQLGTKAPLASPTFTGVPAAPTAAAATNTTQLATTAHVFAERANSATLTNKTLTAPVLSGTVTGTYTLGGTPTIAQSGVTSLTSDLALKAPLASPTFTGTVTASEVAAPGMGTLTLASGGFSFASGNYATDAAIFSAPGYEADASLIFSGPYVSIKAEVFDMNTYGYAPYLHDGAYGVGGFFQCIAYVQSVAATNGGTTTAAVLSHSNRHIDLTHGASIAGHTFDITEWAAWSEGTGDLTISTLSAITTVTWTTGGATVRTPLPTTLTANQTITIRRISAGLLTRVS